MKNKRAKHFNLHLYSQIRCLIYLWVDLIESEETDAILYMFFSGVVKDSVDGILYSLIIPMQYGQTAPEK